MSTALSSNEGELTSGMRREPLLLALGIIAIYTVLAFMVLAAHDWDPKAFVLQKPEEVPFAQAFAIGYDGQFAYAIALDPLGAGEGDDLDRPAYRYLRIIYPVGARMLGLGNADLIPWSLLVLNILVAGATAWVFADLIGLQAGAVWAVLALLLSLNYLIGVRFDLNEPLALFAALVGLRFHKQGRTGLAVATFAIAGLTKEVFLAFPLAAAVYETTRRQYKVAGIIFLGSALPYVAWSAVVAQWQGSSPFAYSLSRPNLIPFAGLQHLELMESKVIVMIWAIGPTLLAALAVVGKSVRDWPQRPGLAAWLVLLNAAVIATLPTESWEDPLAVLRLALGAMAAGFLWLSQVQPRLLPYSAAIWIPSLLIAFILPGMLI